MAIRNPLLFFVDLARQPLWVSIWVVILALANIACLLFWPALVAKLILITFLLSALMMMALYSYYGFEKILGLGHVLWVFLLPYIILQLPHADGGLLWYLVALSILLTISLVLDTVDIWKHFHDRRT
jgi:hypothetical protein